MISATIIILATLSVLLIRVLRGLNSETSAELKRRARGGDIDATRTYKLMSRTSSELHLLVFILILLSISATVILASRSLPFTGAWGISAGLGLIIITGGFSGRSSILYISRSSIIFDSMLRVLAPLLKYPSKIVSAMFQTGPNKKISSKDELLDLVEKESHSSLLSDQQKKTIKGSLTYADKKIREIMIPNSVVKSISAEEVLSPVVIGELHESGFSRFPVISAKDYVGTLYMKDAVSIKNNKRTSEVMRPEVYYLNEEQSLQDALKAFLKTKHHLFMVVNGYEDVVGIITIEDVLEQIIGEKIIDEFDQYEDLKLMARQLAQEKRDERS